MLSPKAFAALVMLVSNSGRLLTKEELMRAVWADTVVEENSLDKIISLLRKTLGGNGESRKLIETVRGRGYRFNAQVTVIESPRADNTLRIATSELFAPPTSLPSPSVPPADELPAMPAWTKKPIPAKSLRVRPGFKLALLFLAALFAAGSLWVWRRKAQSGAESRGISIMRLNNDSPLYGATLSPDGKYYVYVGDENEQSGLWLRPVAGGEPLELTPTIEQRISGTTFSPDAGFIYFVIVDHQDLQGALYRISTLGGPRTKLLTNIASPVTFSSDGHRMAFTRYGEDNKARKLVISDSDGGHERTLLTTHDPEWLGADGPAWSPDGQEIACQVVSMATPAKPTFCKIMGVNERNGALRPLTAQMWEGCGRICWLPDARGFVLVGTKLVESGLPARDQVWYVTQPEGKVQGVTDGLSRHLYGSLGVSGNGRNLFAVQFDYISQIWSVPAERRSGRLHYLAESAAQLTTGTNEGRAGIASLAGGKIVFVARTGDHVDLWEINDNGRQHRQMTTTPEFLEEVSAPADGRFFVFSSPGNDRRSHLFRMDADSGNLRQLTSGESYEVDSDCSSDGRWIVYASQSLTPGSAGKEQIWKIPAEGGSPVRLTDDDASTPRFSPDGKWLSYICPADPQKTTWNVVVTSAEGSALVKSFDLPPNSLLNEGCRWTPNGQALTYIVKGGKFSNVWAQPLNGNPPYPLTDFTSGHIYNYAFARDGQHLYLARGYPTQDALLVRDFR